MLWIQKKNHEEKMKFKSKFELALKKSMGKVKIL